MKQGLGNAQPVAAPLEATDQAPTVVDIQVALVPGHPPAAALDLPFAIAAATAPSNLLVAPAQRRRLVVFDGASVVAPDGARAALALVEIGFRRTELASADVGIALVVDSVPRIAPLRAADIAAPAREGEGIAPIDPFRKGPVDDSKKGSTRGAEESGEEE